MKKNVQQLNEQALTQGLKPVAEIDGVTLYSSGAVKEEFIGLINKSHYASKYSDIFERMVKNGIITPVYSRGGLIQSVFKTIFRVFPDFGGLYDSTTNRIYVVVDIQSGFMGLYVKYDMSQIIPVIVHELMHYAAANHINIFFKVFDKTLTDYYTNFFKIYTDGKCKPSSEQIKKYIQMVQAIEIKNEIDLEKYSKIVKSLMKNCDESYSDTIDNIMVRILQYGLNGFFGMLGYDDMFLKVFRSLYSAYRIWVPKSTRLNTSPIQEFLFPSEIIQIISMYVLTPEIVKMLDLISREKPKK